MNSSIRCHNPYHKWPCSNSQWSEETRQVRGPWKTRESVELATLEWVSWFNHQRLMGPLGYIPPAEAEADYDRQLNRQAALAA
jgi:putative transposase